jgi:ribonuclease P protein component
MAASACRPELQAREVSAPFSEDWPIAMRLARLTQRKEFLAAAEHGRRFRSSAFTVQVLDAPPPAATGADGHDGLRLGLTASRKVGNAVKRNRIRRRLRAAAGIALAEQAGRACDVVIVARPETLAADFQLLVAELSVALDRARPARPGRRSSSDSKSSPDKRRSPDIRSAPSKP